MEKQKLLWVSLSIVAVLTLFTLAAFLLYPKALQKNLSETTETEDKNDFDYVDYTKGRDNFPGLSKDTEEAATPGFSVVLGENEEQNQETLKKTEDKKSEKNETDVTETEDKKSTEEEKTHVQVKTLAEAPQKKYKTNHVSSESRTLSSQKKPSAVSHKKTVPNSKTKEYWIQVASLSSMTSANTTVSQLREKGFNAKLFHFTKENGVERSFYRVRLGPYSQKEEAKQLLNWVRQIKDYKDSYITEVYKPL